MIFCEILNKKRYTVILSVFLSLIVFALYFQVKNHNFISYDDPDYVTENFKVQKGLTVDSIKWAFKYSSQGDRTYWHPVTWLSHMLDCQLFGLDPSGHHMMNLVLHLMNTLLLFLFLRVTTGAIYRSAFVAALFALHPINVDSVAWVAERKNLISAFFWFLTLLIYLWYTKSPGKLRYLLVFISMGIGLLAKPILVTLPCVLLLIDYWPLGRISVKQDKGSLSSFLAKGLLLVKEKVPLFALSAIWSILSEISIQRIDARVSMISRPMDLRICNAIVSYVKYIIKIVWPFDLTIFYPYPNHIPFWQTAIAGVTMLSASYWILKRFNQYPWLVVGWLWYLGTLVPVLGLTQNGLWPEMADRWAYLPTVGIFIMAGWGLHSLYDQKIVNIRTLLPTVSFLLVTITLITWIQLSYWYDNERLFRHAIDVTEDNGVGHNNLGTVLMARNDLKEAIYHFQKAEKIMPELAGISTNMGIAFSNLSRHEKAFWHFKNALKKDPYDKKTHNKLGVTLKRLKRYDEAIYHFRKAIELSPEYADAYNNIGNVFKTMHRLDDALTSYKKALKYKPDSPKILNNIGTIYANKNDLDKALLYYQKAVAINSNLAAVHKNLGDIFIFSGNIEKAEYHYRKAFNLNPLDSVAEVKLRRVLFIKNQLIKQR